MELILEGVDPRLFNLIASCIAEILQFAGAFTLCAFVHLTMSIFLRKGNKVPAQALGQLPDSLIASVQFAHNMKWAWPATLALVLFISDYSTVIAFAGLDFELVDQQGAAAPVLNLGLRNGYFPYAAIGDPLLPFTSSRLELLLEQSRSFELQEDEIVHLLAEETMVASFLGAADAIARGESVFLQQNKELTNDPTLLVVGRTDNEGFLGNWTDSTVIYDNSSFLAAINLEIPLTCSDDVMKAIEEQRDQDTWMTSIEERHGPDDWTTTSHIPNCTFTSRRTSGIYGGVEVNTSPEITAYARVGAGVDVKLQTRSQGPVDDGSTFVFPYEGLYLARELTTFREGRRVFGFEGVQIGSKSIPFDMTAVSSGLNVADPPTALDPTNTNTLRTREYTLISSVKDAMENCPSDPSGSKDSVCMVSAKITCETFHSEIGYGGVLHGYGGASGEGTGVLDLQHSCVFDGDVEIIWGTNYSVDLQLLAAVAGVQSRNVGWASSLLQKRTLSIHSVPSALFLLGTLKSRASIGQVRSTRINGIFIIFMCVPACLCVIAGCVYLIGRKYLLPFPDDGCAAMELGAKVAQQHEIQATAIPLKVALSRPFGWNGAFLVSDMGEDIGIHNQHNQSSEKQQEMKQLMAEQVIDVDEIIGERVDNANDVNDANEGVALVEDTGPTASQSEPWKTSWKYLTALLGLPLDDLATHGCSESKGMRDHVKGLTTSQPKDCEKGGLDQDSCQSTGGPSNKSLGEDNVADLSAASELVKTRTNSFDDSAGRGTRSVVAGCMIFCIAVVILGSSFINAKSVGPDSKQSLHQLETLVSPIKNQDQQEQNIPPHCFVDSNHLRTSLSGYLYGSQQVTTNIIEQHGQFETWCVDFVDDMSFMFAGLPKQHKLNASGWNVSGVTKFSFSFYNYDFAENVFDLSKWDVSSGVYFHGMFSRAKRLKSDLSKWNVSSGIAFNSMFQSSSIASDISQWDVSSANNLNGMFAQTSFNPDLSQWDVSSVTDFSGVFQSARFNSNISQWDVSSGTVFSWMFSESSSFNTDISQWDVSSGTDFSKMFEQASFNSDISHWDVSSCTDFSGMFSYARTFNANISQWNVSSGTFFRDMFHEARDFNADISKWDVSSGTDFSSMFSGADLFNADLSQWDVSSGIDFSWVFYYARTFNANISQWNVMSGTTFSNMFGRANKFNADLSNWDVSSGTDFSGMFQLAQSFNSNISQWDVSSGIDFSGMFDTADSFNADLSNWDVSSGSNFRSMFRLADSFNGDISHWDVSSGTDFSGMFLIAGSFNADISQWDVSSGTYFSIMFSSAAMFNADISQWDVSSGTYFGNMFSDASSFNIDLSQWDVSSGTEFGYMFSDASNFNADLSNWDVSSGTYFTRMFDSAISFNADISHWDVSSGVHFGGMFSEATGFNADISLWNVSSGIDFSLMFFEATSFSIDLSRWDVSSGLDFNRMFYSTSSFNVNLCAWQMAEEADTEFMFLASGCPYADFTEDTICQKCSPTAMPTMSPSAGPTSSMAPSVSGQFRMGVDATYPIPASGTAGSQTIPFSISAAQYDCQIEDMDVEIELEHSYASDLEVQLCHPDGTCVRLFNAIGGNSDLDIRKSVTLDDEALESIATTIADSNPVGRPIQFLSTFDGKGFLGVWQLHFNDSFPGDGGFFYSLYFDVTCAVKHPTTAPSDSPTVGGLLGILPLLP